MPIFNKENLTPHKIEEQTVEQKLDLLKEIIKSLDYDNLCLLKLIIENQKTLLTLYK
jgi:Na+-translocating ferredoxin:NAD+ oxidoreductase RnfG subunit